MKTTKTKYRSVFVEKLLYPFHVAAHPLEGFYEIRHRGRGSVLVALLLVFLYGVSYSINRQKAGFVVNFEHPLAANVILDIQSIFILVLLFCVANWSITCLMEGEGRFKDIVTVAGYSMLPMVLTLVPLTIISNVIAANEEAFYNVGIYGAMAYFGILLLIGIMTVHNYSLGKTLFTALLTIIAMFLIMFLFMLIYTLAQEMIRFFSSIYTELIFRT